MRRRDSRRPRFRRVRTRRFRCARGVLFDCAVLLKLILLFEPTASCTVRYYHPVASSSLVTTRHAPRPPSMVRHAPVIIGQSAESMNAAAAATSSAVPMRPTGNDAFCRACVCIGVVRVCNTHASYAQRAAPVFNRANCTRIAARRRACHSGHCFEKRSTIGVSVVDGHSATTRTPADAYLRAHTTVWPAYAGHHMRWHGALARRRAAQPDHAVLGRTVRAELGHPSLRCSGVVAL